MAGGKRTGGTKRDTETNKNNPQYQAIEKLSKQLNDAITYKKLNFVIFFACFSMVIYAMMFGNNIRLLYNYYIKGDYWYFSFLLTFIVLPGVITAVESYRFYTQNRNAYIPRNVLPAESLVNWAMKWIFGIILACSIPRYLDIINYALKAKRAKKTNDDEKKINFVAMIWEDAELTILNLFLCFMRSAAQLLLNLYIMLNEYIAKNRSLESTTKDESNIEVSSMMSWIFPIISIINLSWTLVSYDQKISLMYGIKRDKEDRQNNQSSDIGMNDMSYIAIHYMINTNWTNCFLLILSHSLWIVSRVIALSFFAIEYGWKILPVCIARLILAFICHMYQNYRLMDSLKFSFIHLFAYLYPLTNESDKKKHPRFSPALYQLVCLLENIFLMWTVSLKVGDGTFHHGIPSWNEWTFYVSWIVQLATMAFSCLLFWWLNKKRQV